jgi:hypothetical protein
VQAAQRVLGEHGDIALLAYERVVSPARVPTRGERARRGYGPGNMEGLRRRGAVRIPDGRRVRVLAEGDDDGTARSAASAVAGERERARRARIGDAASCAKDGESVSSRTRSRSVRWRVGGGGRR